jgi:hypothetical protein
VEGRWKEKKNLTTTTTTGPANAFRSRRAAARRRVRAWVRVEVAARRARRGRSFSRALLLHAPRFASVVKSVSAMTTLQCCHDAARHGVRPRVPGWS